MENSSIIDQKKSYTLALVTVLFWSTVATAFKIGLKNYSPAMLLFWASCSSVIVLFIVLLLTKKVSLLKTITPQNLMVSAGMGLITPFAYYLVIFKSYSLLPAQLAQPLNMIWPIVLVLLSIPILKQKVGWRSLIALLISFFGVVFISSQGSLSNFKNTNYFGVALALGSSILWSFYWIFNQKRNINGELGLFLNFIFGSIYIAIYLLVTKGFQVFNSESFYAAIYIGIFETGLSFVLWLKALSLTNNKAKIANLIYIAPFLSLIFIHFIVGEKIFFSTIIGLIFIISGILFQQTEKKQLRAY